MRKLVLAAVVLLAACGGGENGSNTSVQTTNAAPVISNLVISPLAAKVGSGSSGSGSGTIAFDFTSSADIVQVNVNDSVDFGTQTAPITGFSGLRSGHITLPIAYPTSSAQDFTFVFWVSDSNGHVSNQLNGMIPIGN